MFAPFLVGFALCISDGDADLPQHLLVNLTDRCSQRPDSCRGIEIKDRHEIFVVEVAFRFQSTAGHQSILSPQDRGILKNIEGVDLVPSNIGLSSFEVSLVNTMSREFVLRSYLGTVKRDYDYVLIDCMPSLGMLTINALAAADSVLIPCQANYLSTKGLKLLLGSVAKVRRQINPLLKIDGILLTMVDSRTNNAKSIIAALRQTGRDLRVLNTEVPFSVRAAECSVEGKSIFAHDSKGKVAAAYTALVKEVIALEQRNRNRPGAERGL